MSKDTTYYVLYNDDDVLLDAVKRIRKAGYAIKEVYTPFPVHGLDHAMGLKHTRLAKAAFIYGFIGLCFALWMVNKMMITDWPRNIGGKPAATFLQNLPSFIPVCFEFTVYFAAHLMVITFYMRSKLWPLKKPENPDPRTTDDHFLVEVPVAATDEAEAKSFFEQSGAVEVKIKSSAGDK